MREGGTEGGGGEGSDGGHTCRLQKLQGSFALMLSPTFSSQCFHFQDLSHTDWEVTL